MLYTLEAVKANIRNRAGKRIFVLGKHDTLTPSARDYLSRERIAKLAPHAYVINVGRGTAIDQEALVEALQSGQIAACGYSRYLDCPLLKVERSYARICF